jgi:murein tripeptide amidase MpaA
MRNKMKVLVLILLTIALICQARSVPDPGDQTQLVKLKVEDYQKYVSCNPPLDRLFYKGGIGYFLISKKQLSILTQTGLPFDRLPDPPASTQRMISTSGDINGPFHNYRETGEMLQGFADAYPNLAQLSSMGQSLEGRSLYVLKISDSVHIDENEPNIYIIGCHHAREWISVEVPLMFARYLLENVQNQEIQKIVNGAQIYIIPMLNPDGLEFSIHFYRMWRKNRRHNGNYIFGVDLNRNYGYQWGYDDQGSSPHAYQEDYRGSAPFSEPETSAIRELMLTHPPAGSISYHNFSQMIFYPWGYTSEPAPDEQEMREIARQMSIRMEAVNGRPYPVGTSGSLLYLTNGDTDDWVYATFGAPALTIELPPDEYLRGGFFNPDTDINGIFNENLPALLYFANYFIDTPHRQIQSPLIPQRKERTKPTEIFKR